MIRYCIIDDIDGFQQVVDLEIAVWGLDPRDSVPANIMRAITLNGGLVVGAYDQTKLVGMTLAFPAFRDGTSLLWSHMAGVDRTYQAQGIGYGLKQFQRTWAREHGYSQIGWTFDPIQRGNANFNIHKLGARAVRYHINFYGQMSDSINKGMPSDRVEAAWRVDDTPHSPETPSFTLNASLLSIDKNNQPALQLDNAAVTPRLFIQIPKTIKTLNADQLYNWRIALREAFSTAFTLGYVAVNFIDLENAGIYLLEIPT
jgi:predicted GNAT superfamily acetyltransferase